MRITKRTFSFSSKYDGVKIHGICMIPENPIGIFQMVHGMSEHKERFLPFMEWMAEQGYVALMHDNRGHGESIKQPEDIGYCYASKEKGYIEDIYAVTRHIRKQFPDLPLVLYGHSMGSLGVRSYIRKHDEAVDGLIVSGCPAYNRAVKPAKLLVRAVALLKGDQYRSPFMQKLVVGNFERVFKKENRQFAWLAAKEDVAEKFQADQLCSFTYTLNGFMTLLNLESITYTGGGFEVKQPKLPILFVSGQDDPCYVSEKKWRQAVERLSKLGYENITEIRYKGLRHEIHNEEEYEKVFRDMESFCAGIVKNHYESNA